MTTLAASKQTPPLIRVAPHSPLITIDAARALLGREYDADDILMLVDDGFLPWAFSIATRASRRREIRLLDACVEHYRLTQGHREFVMDWPEVIKLIWPPARAIQNAATSIELAASLCCSSDTCLSLIGEKSLHLVPGTIWRRGNGGSPLVTKESFVQFLKNRRLT